MDVLKDEGMRIHINNPFLIRCNVRKRFCETKCNATILLLGKGRLTQANERLVLLPVVLASSGLEWQLCWQIDVCLVWQLLTILDIQDWRFINLIKITLEENKMNGRRNQISYQNYNFFDTLFPFLRHSLFFLTMSNCLISRIVVK